MRGVLDGADGKPVLFVGSDEDYAEAVKLGYAILVCAKDGPHGHRHMLGYKSLGAPKDANYFYTVKGKRMALNLLDHEDPEFIPPVVIFAGLNFINHRLKEGDKVLVHCNAGHSRAPTMAEMFLRAIGELTSGFGMSEKVFRSLYPKYDPGVGMRSFARTHWAMLQTFFKREGKANGNDGKARP